MGSCNRVVDVAFALVVGVAVPACLGVAFAQQAQQPDPKYLVGPLQAQRDQAANQAALCGADTIRLQEELAALKKRVAELEEKK